MSITKCNEITPALGIGDLLVIKMNELTTKTIINNINIVFNVLKTYRVNPNKNLVFLCKFIQWLFPDAAITIDYTTTKEPERYEPLFDNMYIYDCVSISNTYIVHEEYIIFHTKIRLDGCMDVWMSLIHMILVY